MQLTDVAQMFAQAGLTDAIPSLPQLLRPSIRLTSQVVDETTIALGASKLGGRPDLAPDVAWPMWHGVAMAFIAQIRLEDAAPFDVAHQLPATGLLSFFYDSQQATCQ